MKKQLEQQKQYNKNKQNITKSELDQYEEKTTMNNNNNTVQVQNLCEVNYMFNKAGFGLPMDEASLIYLTMKEMAQLNKFESIRYGYLHITKLKIWNQLIADYIIQIICRFWGKIFGIKKMYYVIECKWSDPELERKLLVKISASPFGYLYIIFVKFFVDGYLDCKQWKP